MDLASWLLFLLLAIFSNPSAASSSSSSASRYIIQVEEPIESLTEANLKIWYESFLPPAAEESGADQRLLHSYSEVFSGFAAMLTEEELQAVGKKNGFVRALPDRLLRVMTTHTPDFLGLKVGKKGLWNDSNLGTGVIIGVLDTGVTPGHPSYDDEGVPPPPSKWKGSCELETGCNNKLIGARSMLARGGGSPPIDKTGHGTHTSSTAAGNFVPDVSYYGLAEGTAAGMAPRAHLAIYQVCLGEGDSCSDSDILAGLDAAVKDGVDVLSISLGGVSTPLDQDLIAIGTFSAARKGIFVSCAGGNSGPGYYTLSNEAPWILTVAASSVDRSFRASVNLPNRKVIPGESLDQPSNFTKSSLPLYYSTEWPTCNYTLSNEAPWILPVAASSVDRSFKASVKLPNGKVISGESLDQPSNFTKSSLPLYDSTDWPTCSMDPPEDSHRGSIWVCEASDRGPKSVAELAKSNGASALIYIYPQYAGATIQVEKMDFPGVILAYQYGSDLISYLNSSSNPSASIVFNGTVLVVPFAPDVAFFSSRGPSRATPGILKPDISGPGLNIFAAWVPSIDTPPYNIDSGTSMAAPHLSGVAALIKAVHPTWSPAAIKSAIVTTADADVSNELLEPAFYFAKGAGLVNPNKAADPGLIYDITPDDYIAYICGKLGNDGARKMGLRFVNCCKSKCVTESELNYPSILLLPSGGAEINVSRTVTNVGSARSKYTVAVKISETAVSVTVTPKTLTFTELNEQKSFSVSAKLAAGHQFVEGKLTWTSDDNKHVVTSPLVVLAGDQLVVRSLNI